MLSNTLILCSIDNYMREEIPNSKDDKNSGGNEVGSSDGANVNLGTTMVASSDESQI